MEADDNLGAVIGQDDDRDDVLELTELFQEQLDQLMNSTLNIAKARLRRQHNEQQLALTQICYNALLHKTGEGNISDRQLNSVLQRQHQHGHQRVRPPLEELRLGGDPC